MSIEFEKLHVIKTSYLPRSVLATHAFTHVFDTAIQSRHPVCIGKCSWRGMYLRLGKQESKYLKDKATALTDPWTRLVRPRKKNLRNTAVNRRVDITAKVRPSIRF